MVEKIKRIAIIGVGMIGGSVGLALKKRHLVEEVCGIGRRQESLERALEVGAVDHITLDFELGVKNADLVVIATPVRVIPEMLRRIAPYAKRDCIITDVGSTKAWVVRKAEELTGDQLAFIGGHPLAGSDKEGIAAADGDLFEGATWVLTPGPGTVSHALVLLDELYQSVGANITLLSPNEHDRLVASSSHLPHIVAVSLVNTVGEVAGEDQRLIDLIAGGFRDTTRIASSSPVSWCDICLTNKDEIINILHKYRELLDAFEEVVSSGNEKDLHALFTQAKSFRDNVMK